MRITLQIVFIFVIIASCKTGVDHPVKHNSLFTLLPSSETGITFENNVVYQEEFNVYTYRNFYNGAGVGLGDIIVSGPGAEYTTLFPIPREQIEANPNLIQNDQY